MRQLKITKSITNRDTQAIDKYLQEISKEDLISAEEEVILAQKIKQWDTQALNKLAKANLRFVVSVAKQYQHRWLPLSDLINEGNLWLMKAATKYDETRWFKFISYAVWRIRQSILLAINEYGRIVRLPLNKIWDVNKVTDTVRELEQTLEREPTDDELLEAGIAADEIATYYTTNRHHTSLDAPIGEDGDITLMDLQVWSTANDVTRTIDDNEIKKVIIQFADAVLTPKQKDIIFLLYGIGVDSPWSPDSIWEKYGKSAQQIRNIKEKALSLLGRKRLFLTQMIDGNAIGRIKPKIKKPKIPVQTQRIRKTKSSRIKTIESNSWTNTGEIIDTLADGPKKYHSIKDIETHLLEYIKSATLDHIYISTLDTDIAGYTILEYLCSKYIVMEEFSSIDQYILSQLFAAVSIKDIADTLATKPYDIIWRIVPIYEKIQNSMQYHTIDKK